MKTLTILSLLALLLLSGTACSRVSGEQAAEIAQAHALTAKLRARLAPGQSAALAAEHGVPQDNAAVLQQLQALRALAATKPPAK